jgi:hypothetical protein
LADLDAFGGVNGNRATSALPDVGATSERP